MEKCLPIRYTLEEIIHLVQPDKIQGRSSRSVFTGIASLDRALAGDLSFLGNLKYKSQVFDSKASLILLPNTYIGTPRKGQVFLWMENPSRGLDAICRDVEQKIKPKVAPGVHPSAIIDPTAKISKKAFVGPLCVIGAHSVIEDGVALTAHVYVGQQVTIRSNTVVRPHVSLLDGTQVGRRCYIDAGVVIGSEGYGYETEKGVHRRSPQRGHVVLEDEVDVGANTTIDRARFDETRIGEGTKIDNLVQIAHNVVIGKRCFLVALVGIAGSTHIGDDTIIAGQVGIAGHLRIGNHVTIGAQSGVAKDVEDHDFVRGSPAISFMLAHRIEILKNRLPELFKRVDNLEKIFAYLTDDAAKSCFLPKKSKSKNH